MKMPSKMDITSISAELNRIEGELKRRGVDFETVNGKKRPNHDIGRSQVMPGIQNLTSTPATNRLGSLDKSTGQRTPITNSANQHAPLDKSANQRTGVDSSANQQESTFDISMETTNSSNGRLSSALSSAPSPASTYTNNVTPPSSRRDSSSTGSESAYSSLPSPDNTNSKLYVEQKFDEKLLIRQGSVRGVENGVNNTIKRLRARNNWKRNYQQEDRDKVVVYVTSCSVVRQTFVRCRDALSILEKLNVRFDCRDMHISSTLYDELCNRIGGTDKRSKRLHSTVPTNVDAAVWDNLPMVYVGGEYFGDETTLEYLNETGQLKAILAPYTSSTRTACHHCFGYQFHPCQACSGGKRSALRFGELTFRCAKCDDNGIVPCKKCRAMSDSSSISTSSSTNL